MLPPGRLAFVARSKKGLLAFDHNDVTSLLLPIEIAFRKPSFKDIMMIAAKVAAAQAIAHADRQAQAQAEAAAPGSKMGSEALAALGKELLRFANITDHSISELCTTLAELSNYDQRHGL
jgi:DNA invertase Pin-like site-specific DNA recombinase